MAESKVCKKLKVDRPDLWLHHRGGWNYAMSLLKQELQARDGTLCISSVEDYVCDELPVDEPWIGFVHQVTRTDRLVYPWFPDLERLTTSQHFLEKMLPNCQGLFVLSSTVKNYLTANLPLSRPTPVVKLWYPATPCGRAFDFVKFKSSSPRKVLFIGEYQRNFKAFNDLTLPGKYQKVLLKAPDVNFDQIRFDNSVKTIEHVPNDEYDRLLSESIVFLNLFDAPANTTVIECLMRNCPLVVNRLPGLEEYLGTTYPLFYDGTDLDAAARLITTDDSLREAVCYMQSCKLKENLHGHTFVKGIRDSAIYRSLPTPPSQANSPLQKHFNVTVVICSYKRVYNIERILQCFSDQHGHICLEVILWNNNYDERANLDEICKPFLSKLHMKVIHSTENFYCIIRLAVATLMRSDVMLICDDDVIPAKNFVQRFLEKYEEYGPDAVLCCRGHTFDDHQLNEEEPQLCWEEYEDLHFHGQGKDDMQIHFLHADTCLFPRHLLLKAAAYELPSREFILVDDYWLSFVFSHHLGIPIWKIKGDDIFDSTECSEDREKALFYNPRVEQQRIEFYIYHMRQGWPKNLKEKNAVLE